MIAAGVDVGTTSVKVAVVETGAAARILATRSIRYPSHRPLPGRHEQDPADWVRCAVEALDGLEGVDRAEVVGVSGQGSTFALCDAEGRARGRAIGWQDQRALAEAREIGERLRPLLAAAHGNLIGDAPEPKLVWLGRHEPDRLDDASVALSAAGVVACAFGAEPAINAGDASSFLAFDRHRLAWHPELAQALGVQRLLPPVVRAGDVVGHARRGLAVREGVPVVATMTDVAAAAVGAGAAAVGDVFYSKGTGGFLSLTTGAVADPGRLVALALGRGDLTQLCAAIDALGSAWDWARALVGGVDNDAANTAAAGAATDGLVALPWLQGAQHPVLAPDARGSIGGLSFRSGRGELLRAVLEGTAALLRWNLDELEGASGSTVGRLVASGGPTRSALWNALDAAAVERPIEIVAETDAAVGAALIAAGAEADAVRLRGEVRVVEPDPALAEAARTTRAGVRVLAAVSCSSGW